MEGKVIEPDTSFSFCDSCFYCLIGTQGRMRCKVTGAMLNWYDRSCQFYVYVPEEPEKETYEEEEL